MTDTYSQTPTPQDDDAYADLVPKAPAAQSDDAYGDLVPKPRAGVMETAGAIGQQLADVVTTHAPAGVAAAVAGGNITPGSRTDSWIEQSRELARQRAQESGKGPTMIPFISREDIAALGPSLGYSVPTTGAGLAVGMAARAVPVVGPVVGVVGGLGTVGALAARQSMDSFSRDIRDTVNEERKSKGLPDMSPEELNAKLKEMEPLILKYGAWEAAPEVAGSAISFGILKAPIKVGIGKIFGDSVLKRFITKTAGIYGGELATETVTQHGQHNVGIEAGTEKGDPRSWLSPSDLKTSFGEIAGPTILQTTLMAGAFRLAQGRRADGSPPSQEEVAAAYKELSDKDPPVAPTTPPEPRQPPPGGPTDEEWEKLKGATTQPIAQTTPQVAPLPDLGPILPAPEPVIKPYEDPNETQFDVVLTRAGDGVNDSGYGLHYAEDAMGDASEEMRARIRAPREAFLDLDQPLAAQPEVVEKIPPSVIQPLLMAGVPLAQMTGRQVIASMESQVGSDGAARMLQEWNIPGVKYLNQGSTAEARPTQTYVVSDRRALGIPRMSVANRSKISTFTPSAFAKRQELKDAVYNAVRKTAGPTAAARLEQSETLFSVAASPAWGGKPGQMSYASGLYYPWREKPGKRMRPKGDSFEFEESWINPLIQVSTAVGIDAVQTGMHEAWHAIEGTLTKEELAILRAATPQLREYISRLRPDRAHLYKQAEEEEIWAEASSMYAWERMLDKAGTMALYSEMHHEALHPAVRYIFDKIRNLLESIRNAVNGLGFDSANSIFEGFYRGENAERREKAKPEMLQRWWANESGITIDGDMVARLDAATAANNSAMASVEEREQAPIVAQPELLPARAMVDKLYHNTGGVPAQARQALAHADRVGWLKKWWWGLDRLVDKFPDFQPLVKYSEITSMMRRETSRIHDAAIRIAKDWRALGNGAEGLAALIDDVTNMNYRTPSEVARGIVRHPTAAEFNSLVARHKVTAAALRVFNLQKKFFENFLDITAQNAIAHARRVINDPVDLAQKIHAIQSQTQALKAKPYFPFMRFGIRFIQVRDASGKVVHFETVERRGVQSAIKRQKIREKQLQASVPAGHTVTIGTLPDQATPFVGMPPTLLESIASELQLNAAQRTALDQLRYHLAPAASFSKRFIQKDYTPGYSHDFLRAFSRYAFNGARYYARTKYSWMLQEQIDASEKMPGNLAGEVANFLRDHLSNTITNTRGDWGRLKGAIFTWVFAYSPAGAIVNLSQLTIAHNFMAAQFGGLMRLGDVKAAAALAKALVDVRNFYRRGSYDNKSQFWMKAMQYGVQSGRISEAMAAELAGIAQGESLLGMGNNRVGRGIQIFLEKGAFMFEMAEQVNRRATFRAALDLAQLYPNAKAVKMAMAKYADEYNQLISGGKFTPSEAQAVVTASYVVDQTQYSYAKENRPRVARGGLAATILVFKSYMLNTLQLLGANKTSVLPRYMLTMMFLAGMMGLPGAGEFEALANALGRWYFGKDFKLSLWLRENLKDIVGEEHSDLVLHGLGSRGMGLPGVVDMMGEHVYGNKGRGLRLEPGQNVPFPMVDMSRALGMQNILPFELDKLLDPGKDVNRAIAEQSQRATGAVFSVGFNMYRAIMDTNTSATDWKRWERAMPRALASTSRAYRAYSEGRERSGVGGPNSASSVISYDPRDPEQMAEILAVAAGFMPSRLSAQWDFIMAQQEVNSKIDFERTILLRQMFEAQKGGNPREIDDMRKAIRDFNDNLPEFAKEKALTNETVRRSMAQRERVKGSRDAGVPLKKNERGVHEHMRGLFPKSVVDAKKVKE